MGRTKAEDAARKREYRARLRQEKQERRLREEAERLNAPLRAAEMIVERIAQVTKWLADAETAAGDRWAMTRLSVEIRDSLVDRWGERNLNLRSWNGIAWLDPGDIRTVLLEDLEGRGLLEKFLASQTATESSLTASQVTDNP